MASHINGRSLYALMEGQHLGLWVQRWKADQITPPQPACYCGRDSLIPKVSPKTEVGVRQWQNHALRGVRSWARTEQC